MNPPSEFDKTSNMGLSPQVADACAEVTELLKGVVRLAVLVLAEDRAVMDIVYGCIGIVDSLVPTLGQAIDLLETLSPTYKGGE